MHKAKWILTLIASWGVVAGIGAHAPTAIAQVNAPLIAPKTRAAQRETQTQSQPPTVLGIPLGATREQVEAIFSKAQIAKQTLGNGQIAYEEPPAKIKNAGPVYLAFYHDRLARIIMALDITSQTADPYISRYRELKAALTKKYGPPSKSNEWIDSSYRDHPLLAFETGRAYYGTQWSKGDLKIFLVLSGDNYEIHPALAYEYVPLASKLERQEKEKERGNL